MTQKEGINTRLVVTLALITAVFLIVVVFGLEGWFNYEVREERDAMWATMSDKTAIEARIRQEQTIHAAHIDVAMQKIVESGGKVPWKTN